MIPEREIKCNFIDCAAGMGVAGMLSCFLGGDYKNPNCLKFYLDKAFYLEYLFVGYLDWSGYGGEMEQSWKEVGIYQGQHPVI